MPGCLQMWCGGYRGLCAVDEAEQHTLRRRQRLKCETLLPGDAALP